MPTERYGVDLHVAAVRLERLDDGTYRWRAEPKLSLGILPMTALEIRAPLTYLVRSGVAGRGTAALSGVGIGAMRALNVEKTFVPALALAGEVLVPAGGLSTGRTSYAIQMLATKTTPVVRAHLNASFGTYGVRPPRQLPPSGGQCPPGFFPGADGSCQEIIVIPDGPCSLATSRSDLRTTPVAAATCGSAGSAAPIRQQQIARPSGLRWAAGLGVDRTFVFQSMLVSADVVAERFIGLFPDVDWTAEIGVRRQITPQIVLDLGVARRFAGNTPSSSVTAGATYSLGAVFGRRSGSSRGAPRDPSWTGPFEQSYFPARHNWAFRERYPEAERLLSAFDYGHAILYETLLSRSTVADAGARLDGAIYDRVVNRILRRPPRLALEERAIGPRYAALVPELLAMFEWAHVLHRQLYDVLSTRRLTPEQLNARVAEVLRYYQSRPDLALSSAPKSMALMEGQPFSLAFRRAAPKFNGLIWSYHWLQIALYEALLAAEDAGGSRASLDASLGRFWWMLDSGNARLPTVMPMSPAVAPRFSAQFAEAAIIFDNLHALHDVAADILASPVVARSAKRAAILEAAAAYRDSTTAVVSRTEWLEHSVMMGVEQMGGRAPILGAGGVAPGALPRER